MTKQWKTYVCAVKWKLCRQKKFYESASQSRHSKILRLSAKIFCCGTFEKKFEIEWTFFFGIEIVKTFNVYDFFYNHVKKLYLRDSARLLFTDTDSLVYSIKTDDIYKDMLEYKEKFDFNRYDKGVSVL